MDINKLRADLKAALDRRGEIRADLDTFTSEVEARSDGPTEDDTAKLAELRKALEINAEQRESLSERIAEAEKMELDDAEAKRQAAGLPIEDATTTSVRVKSEELTYRQGAQHSYFKDLANASAPGRFDSEARARLERHAKEMDVELRTNPNRTDGTGGEFVPPLWLIDQYVKLARPGRVTADLCSKMDLPPGTDSINLPTIATGATVTGTADATAISNTDITTSSIAAPVNTYAGQQIIAMQLLDQSPISFDQVVFSDLIAEYAKQIGSAVVGGAGTTAVHKGILTSTATNSVTYTATTATASGVYTAVAQGISNVASNRYLPPTAIVMNPQRFYWLASSVDTNGRPFVVMNAGGPNNAAAVLNDTVAEGSAGTMAGLPVYLDPNIGQTYSTNQDRIIVGRFSDAYLFEGPLRSRVLFETDANTLQVRLQVWAYSAFTSYRYPKSFSVLSGTGMAAQSGF